MLHHRPRFALVLSLPLLAALQLWATPAAAAPDDVADSPRGSYVVVDTPPLTLDTPAQAGGAPHILFLNRCTGGVTISPGNEDSSANTSSILSFPVNFPEFPYGDGAWSEVMARTRELYEPFNVQVTDVDPAPAQHDEVIVCGDGGSAGFSGAGGVAPFSCGVIPAAITYVFAETMGNNPEAIAIVVGQESAHAWGLDHEYKCDDPMTYLSWCGDVQFQDGDYACGEYQERECSCGGNTQNSYQHILGLFGASAPDLQTPTATLTSPNDGAEYETGADFEISVEVSDDVDVISVTLYVNGDAQATDDSAPFGPWPAADTPDGDYEFYVEARDFAGNIGASNVVAVHVGAGAGSGSGSDGGGDDDPTEPGDGSDGDAGGDDSDGNDDGGFETAGALPPGFGGARGDEAITTCACSTTDRPAWSITLPWLLAFAARRLVRRRRLA